MTRARQNLLALGILVLFSLGLAWRGFPIWGLLVAYLGGLTLWLLARLRRQSDAAAQFRAARMGESYQTFLDRLNRPDYDPRLVRMVYGAICSLAGFDPEDVALRPYDDLVRDLKIRPEDLGEALWSGLKGPLRLVDTADALRGNPHRMRTQTVGGMIDFFASHPKLDTAPPLRLVERQSDAPLTPSARST